MQLPEPTTDRLLAALQHGHLDAATREELESLLRAHLGCEASANPKAAQRTERVQAELRRLIEKRLAEENQARLLATLQAARQEDRQRADTSRSEDKETESRHYRWMLTVGSIAALAAVMSVLIALWLACRPTP